MKFWIVATIVAWLICGCSGALLYLLARHNSRYDKEPIIAIIVTVIAGGLALISSAGLSIFYLLKLLKVI